MQALKKKEKKKEPLRVGSFEASKPPRLFIESHQHHRYWYLIYMGLYHFCTVNVLSAPFTSDAQNLFVPHKAVSP